MSTIPLRVLIVEDSPDDTTLLVRILRKGGFEPSFERVETEDSMRSALLEKPWDIILSDYRMPTFDGLRALAVLKESGLDIPLIIVSGTIGEEIAVEAMKAGACDYVMKDNLTRLIPAIERELKEAVSRENKRKGERNLQESEDRYRMLADNMEDVIWQVTPDLVFTYVSPSIKKQRGYEVHEVLGRQIWEFITPDSIEPVRTRVAERLELLRTNREGFVPEPYVTEETCMDGTTVWTETITNPVFNDKGQLIAFQGVTRDITGRKKMEQDLQAREELLNSTGRMAKVGGWELDAHTLEVSWTDETYRIHEMPTGYKPPLEEAINFFHEDDKETLSNAIRSALNYGETFDMELRFNTAKGKQLWTRAICQPEVVGGKTVKLKGTFQDITERKLAEDELRESEEKFAKVFHYAPVLITLSNMDDGTYLDVNETFSKVSGFSRAEAIGKTSVDLGWISPEDRKRLIEELQAHGSVRGMDLKLLTNDKREIHIIYNGELIQTKNHQVLLSIAHDITDRKRAEQELRKFKSISDRANYGCAMVDLRGFLTYVNEAFANMHGFSSPELIGKNLSVFHTDEQMEHVIRLIEKLNRDGEFEFQEVWHAKKDGTVFPTLMGAAVIKDDEGTPIFLSATAIDITDRKQAEQDRENLRSQLLQSQKMATIGTLAGGIAHDFNNMLTVILGFSDMLLSDKNEGDPGHEELQKIVKTSEDAADLVQKIRIFGRREEMILVPLDLNHQIDQVTKLLSSTLPKMIEMYIHLSKDPVIISADSAQITQMVMNLTINANEAMPQGGRLSIQTENIVLDNDYSRVHVGVKPGPHVMLTVSDTGRGIDKSLMERIFDPFYSTKTRDYRKGTGLGLSVVQGIVHQHGGHITVESEVGKGTTFRMYFPSLEHEIVPEYVETKIPYSAGGTETILLVEDMELVRDLGVTILEKFGYTVLSAGDGQEALDVYEKEHGNISLVILDIIMPRMDGKECLEELLRINPDVKVIISSGVGQEDLINEVVKIGAKGAVNKPYGMRQLLAMVREVLDGD